MSNQIIVHQSLGLRSVPETFDARQLSTLLKYDNGKLYWKERTDSMFSENSRPREWRRRNWNSRYAGTEAFTSNSLGYQVGRLSGRNYLTHRVVWALHNGRWPEDQIDHINGIRDDNRIENLREVNHSGNARNSKLRVDNTSGVVGVCYNKKVDKWMVQAHGKYFGVYSTFEEAVEKREKINKEDGYHENHGR